MKADQPTRRSRAPECRALTQPFYVSSQPTWYGQHIRELKEDKWLMNIPILRFHLAQALDIWNANSLAPFASIGLLLMVRYGTSSVSDLNCPRNADRSSFHVTDCRWIHRKGRRWIPYMGSGSRWRG